MEKLRCSGSPGFFSNSLGFCLREKSTVELPLGNLYLYISLLVKASFVIPRLVFLVLLWSCADRLKESPNIPVSQLKSTQMFPSHAVNKCAVSACLVLCFRVQFYPFVGASAM